MKTLLPFFENLGIQLKEEDRGRMFPISDKAQTVVDTLLNRIRSLKVDIRTNTEVGDLHFSEEDLHSVLLKDGTTVATKAIIIATGGKSVPHTGSNGSGYPWAKKKRVTRLQSFIQPKFQSPLINRLSQTKIYKDYHYGKLN